METLSTKDLQIGDIVTPEDTPSGFTTCVVKSYQNDHFTLFRPYGTHADFAYTGGVICYIGVEEYQIHRDNSRKWIRHQKGNLR